MAWGFTIIVILIIIITVLLVLIAFKSRSKTPFNRHGREQRSNPNRFQTPLNSLTPKVTPKVTLTSAVSKVGSSSKAVFNSGVLKAKSLFKKKKFDKKVSFVTYGDDLYAPARERLVKEATRTGWFSKVVAHSPQTTQDLRTRYATFFAENKRGGGYWLWKSHIILKELNDTNYGDYLVYCDAGCSLNPTGKKRFLEYLNLINENSGNSILTFHMEHQEKTWTKADLGVKLNVTNNPEIWETGQCLGGIMVIRKTPESVKLVLKWIEVATTNNFHYLTDSPSKTPNDPSFKEHRHDQSIFSILTKIHGAKSLKDETYPPDESRIKGYPFLATRKKD
jgi:hypothetical protein